MNTIIDRGSGDPDSLIKIGAVLGEPPEEMFRLAGWLSGKPSQWSKEAEAAARLVEAADPEARPILLALLEAAAPKFQELEFRVRAVEHLQEAVNQG